MKAVPLSYCEIYKEFVYDENSPSRLSRLVNGNFVQVLGKNKAGYYRVSFKNRRIYAHRIIWLLFYPDYDQTLDIDHIDLDKSNNSLCNLRLVSRSTNLKNKRSSSKHKNIYWDSNRSRYQVYYQANLNRKSKMFNQSDYGSKELALEAAITFRNSLVENGLIILTKEDS